MTTTDQTYKAKSGHTDQTKSANNVQAFGEGAPTANGIGGKTDTGNVNRRSEDRTISR